MTSRCKLLGDLYSLPGIYRMSLWLALKVAQGEAGEQYA